MHTKLGINGVGRTIVVGYDGSPAARAAVELAIDCAGPDGRVVLVHA